MKIISRHKDYYDKCIGYFGRDETRVYDRRISTSLIPEKERMIGKYPLCNSREYFDVIHFHICGKIRIVLYTNNKFYFNNDEIKEVRVKYSIYNYADFSRNGSGTDLNYKYQQPVLIRDYMGGKVGIPILSEFGFPSHIPAEEMYMDIYNYLGYLKDNPPIQNNQSNIEKVLSHGFDKKRSFRPKIKA